MEVTELLLPYPRSWYYNSCWMRTVNLCTIRIKSHEFRLLAAALDQFTLLWLSKMLEFDVERVGVLNCWIPSADRQLTRGVLEFWCLMTERWGDRKWVERQSRRDSDLRVKKHVTFDFRFAGFDTNFHLHSPNLNKYLLSRLDRLTTVHSSAIQNSSSVDSRVAASSCVISRTAHV